MTKKKELKVTLRECRTAFNESGRRKALEQAFPGFMKKLESVFPSRDLDAAVTVKKFCEHARRLTEGKVEKTGDAERDMIAAGRAAYRAQLVERGIAALPPLRRAFEEERKREEAARKREQARFERERRRQESKPETQRQRIDRLEREVAALRAQANERPLSAEEELKVRKWYEDDTRIGGSHDPDPPGLRD